MSRNIEVRKVTQYILVNKKETEVLGHVIGVCSDLKEANQYGLEEADRLGLSFIPYVEQNVELN